jgi:hypothetical protein
MDKPIKQYTQDLIIDTVTHLDSKILIALAHKKVSQLDIHVYVHHDTVYENDQQDATV